jgi:GNAT superfamily N-acetyltransferase
MITLQVEPYASARDDALIKMHYDEIALNKDEKPLNPDWARYEQMEAAGNLVCFTARDDGRMVGYSVFLLSWHLHYNTVRVAANDVLYLHPDYRKGMIGIRLIKYSEAELGKYGADWITFHVKFNKIPDDRKDFSPILHRMGYSDEEKMVGKMIRRTLWQQAQQ